MNSTATFEIVPFGTSSEGEAEEIRGWGRSVPRGFPLAFRGHRPIGPRNWRRLAYDHRHHGAGHVHGGIHHLGGHGLHGHRLVRDFRRRIGLHRPFGPERPPFFGVGGPALDGGAPDAPPPGMDAGAPPPPMALTGGGGGPEEQIRWIQSVLNTVLGTSLPTDGVPSADLRNALQTFQSQHGLPVSGFAGPDTIAALQSASVGQTAPGAAGALQPDAPPAPPAAGGDAPGGEFEIMPAFGAAGSRRMRHGARF